MKPISCQTYNIHFDDWEALRSLLNQGLYSRIFVLVDENTSSICLPELKKKIDGEVIPIQIPSGEQNKDIHTCEHIWDEMLNNGGDRHSVCINLGGGVIGDMGGFCASTFMRGIDFIQIPTTLLSMVDASVGGKLGVDFQGVKNMVGLFRDPQAVFVFSDYLLTLSYRQILSGFAELLKHGLIADEILWKQLSVLVSLEEMHWAPIIHRSIEIKKEVVTEDPKEGGLRKILNFGHTIGHAVETKALDSKAPLLHGEAIAIGMVCEAHLSYQKGYISEAECGEIKRTILKLYGHHPGHLSQSGHLIDLMVKDKKNRKGEIRFSLLKQIGEACYDEVVSNDAIDRALSFYTAT